MKYNAEIEADLIRDNFEQWFAGRLPKLTAEGQRVLKQIKPYLAAAYIAGGGEGMQRGIAIATSEVFDRLETIAGA